MAKATTQTCLKNKGVLMKQGRKEPVRVGLRSGTQMMAPDLTLLIPSWVCCPAVQVGFMTTCWGMTGAWAPCSLSSKFQNSRHNTCTFCRRPSRSKKSFCIVPALNKFSGLSYSGPASQRSPTAGPGGEANSIWPTWLRGFEKAPLPAPPPKTALWFC